jgi:hypothetical protein
VRTSRSSPPSLAGNVLIAVSMFMMEIKVEGIREDKEFIVAYVVHIDI